MTERRRFPSTWFGPAVVALFVLLAALSLLQARPSLARSTQVRAQDPIPMRAQGPNLARAQDPDHAPAQATLMPDQIIVRGRIYHTDRLGDKNHPAAGVKVEIWDLDGGIVTTGEKLDEVMTDDKGRYESKVISNYDRDGPTGTREGTQDVFIKIFSDNGHVRLYKANTTQVFVWNSYEIDPRDGLKRNVPDGIVGMAPLYISEAAKDVEALWTYVNMAEAWLYMFNQTGKDPGSVTGYWSQDSQDGPRVDYDNNTLYFRDEDAGYSSLVMQLEAYILLKNIFGGLPANWQQCIPGTYQLDLRKETDATCAFVQGFASFLPLAVTGQSEYETPSSRALDLDAAKAGSVGWASGDKVPGRIAGAFWDMHENDQTVEEFDRFNASFKDIWEVIDQKRPNTMAEWWAGWKALGKDGCAAVGSLYQNTIDYNTAPQITQIPDVELNEDESVSLNLANYVNDAECPDDKLIFALIDAGAPEAGVVFITATNTISITPQANWHGETRVTVTVSDGLLTSRMSFRVIVKSINDCPKITPRIQDPPPATRGESIVLDVTKYGVDTEDKPEQMSWEVVIPPKNQSDITVAGPPKGTLVFTLDPAITSSYSARVQLILRDRDGCPATQSIALFWSNRLNSRPVIQASRFITEYVAPINTAIHVDLTDVATDAEDGTKPLYWFVVNPDYIHAQVARVSPQIFDFEPDVGFLGTDVAEMEVQDTQGARTTGVISLTWKSRTEEGNLPPKIKRNELFGKTVGLNADACYELTFMAEDPDDSPYALRWFAEPIDETSLFVGPQGTRSLCFTSRPDFEGCLAARIIVKDPHDAQDTHEITTCWRTIKTFLPLVQRNNPSGYRPRPVPTARHP